MFDALPWISTIYKCILVGTFCLKKTHSFFNTRNNYIYIHLQYT